MRHAGTVGVDRSVVAGAVAQLGERRPCKAEVVGSIPISSTLRVGCTLSDRERLDSVEPARSGGSELLSSLTIAYG